MAVTYTTAALVKKRLLKIDSSLVDADIEEFIYKAEGIIDTWMGETFKNIFSSTKHGLIRDTCEALAALMCLTFDVTEFSSNSQAALTGDMFWAIIERNSIDLRSSKIVATMKAL